MKDMFLNFRQFCGYHVHMYVATYRVDFHGLAWSHKIL